ncbi:MFS transporter, partial [Christensenella minuta]
YLSFFIHFRLDFSLQVSCGFGGLLLAFTSLSDYSFFHPLVIVPLAAGILSLVFFVRRQLRIANPLLDVRIFKNRDFAVGTTLISLYYFAFLGMGIVLPIYIQSYLGQTALVSGLTLLPGAFLMAVTSSISGWMLDRLGARATLIIGSAFLAGGTLLLVMTDAGTPMGVLVADYCVRCIGLGFLIMPTTTWSVDSLDLKKMPDGVAINNTMRQVMGAIGSALMVTVMSAAAAGSGFDSPMRAGVYGVHMSFVFSAVLCSAALVLAVIFVRGTKKEAFKKERRRN